MIARHPRNQTPAGASAIRVRPAQVEKRRAVLFAVHADGYVEAFGDDAIDIKIVRVPQAPSPASEALTDDVFELMLPPRYRRLYRADKLRTVGTTRPVLPSVALAARDAQLAILSLSQPNGPARPRKPMHGRKKRRRIA